MVRFSNPRYHQLTDSNMNTVEQRDTFAVPKSATPILDSNHNVKAAVNDTLDDVVAEGYHRNKIVIAQTAG